MDHKYGHLARTMGPASTNQWVTLCIRKNHLAKFVRDELQKHIMDDVTHQGFLELGLTATTHHAHQPGEIEMDAVHAQPDHMILAEKAAVVESFTRGVRVVQSAHGFDTAFRGFARFT